MSEEENKAIEELKSFKKDKDCKYWIGLNGENAIDIILNLIEKQLKELEQEKRKNKELEIIIGEYKNACDNVCETTQNMINNLYISKSKLKDLFEQANAHPVKLYSDIKELLGE